MGFGKHHFIWRHALFALRDLIQVQLQAVPSLTCHLRAGAGQSCRAHILNTKDDAGINQLETSFHDQLLHEWIADLDGRPLRFGLLRQLLGCEGCPVDAVTACRRPNVEYRVAYAFCYTALNLVMLDQTYAHCVN
ncbi:hypothetical protein D3C77_635870 [compost metagenome]